MSGACFPSRNKTLVTAVKYYAEPQGPNLETKIGSQKKSERNEDNSPMQAKTFLGFMKRVSEFAKAIYATCDRNFFNFAPIIAVVLSIVQFKLFLHLTSNI